MTKGNDFVQKSKAEPFADADRCQWVTEGMVVWTRYDDSGTAIKCRVEKALGIQAVVVNERHNFRKLLDVLDLFADDGRFDRA